MKDPLTIRAVLTSDGRFPDRAQKANQAIRDHAADLISRCNMLFLDLGLAERPKVSSGFRTPEANAAAGGAAKSAHLEGKAVDFVDLDSRLKARITTALLKKHGLRMEHPDYTPSWCHLDTRAPAGAIFAPRAPAKGK